VASETIWVIEKFPARVFPSIYPTKYYMRADLSMIYSGKKSWFGFPTVVEPLYPNMCLTFIYLLYGESALQLKLGIAYNNDTIDYIWDETTNSSEYYHSLLITKLLFYISIL
jgi:hypothetical protein